MGSQLDSGTPRSQPPRKLWHLVWLCPWATLIRFVLFSCRSVLSSFLFLLSVFPSVIISLFFFISFEAKKDRKNEHVAKTEQCKDFADLCARAEQLGTATGQEKDMLSVIVDMKNLVILDQKRFAPWRFASAGLRRGT